jgi:hypothetical protein
MKQFQHPRRSTLWLLLILLIPALVICLYFSLLPNYQVDYSGMVVDESGSPISGARVTAELSYETSISPIPFTGAPPTIKLVRVSSDADGRFLIRGRGNKIYFYVVKDGYDNGHLLTPPDRFGFNLHAGGGRKDRDHPAVYVLKRSP